MAISQKQIAEKLGVSIALVSRVLSGKAEEIGIAQDTIRRVIQAAEEMGYVPSVAALSLKGKATSTIGVAVYDFNDPFFGALIKQIQIQAHEHNYSLVLAGFLNRTPNAQDLQSLHKHALDGLLVLGSDMGANWLEKFDHLPIARIGHGSQSEKSLRITMDEENAARKLVEHLGSRGRKKLLFLSGDLVVHRLRETAMQQAASAAGMSLQSLESNEPDAFTAGYRLVKQLPDITAAADALICATDQIAMGALHALYDTKVAVPNAVAVAGFDDIPASEQFIPPITTIRQPIQRMVKEAFQALMSKSSPRKITLTAELIVRRST